MVAKTLIFSCGAAFACASSCVSGSVDESVSLNAFSIDRDGNYWKIHDGKVWQCDDNWSCEEQHGDWDSPQTIRAYSANRIFIKDLHAKGGLDPHMTLRLSVCGKNFAKPPSFVCSPLNSKDAEDNAIEAEMSEVVLSPLYDFPAIYAVVPFRRVVGWDDTGNRLGPWGLLRSPPDYEQTCLATAVAGDSAGNVYIGCEVTDRDDRSPMNDPTFAIKKCTTTGVVIPKFECEDFHSPRQNTTAIAIGSNDEVYFSNGQDLTRCSPDGSCKNLGSFFDNSAGDFSMMLDHRNGDLYVSTANKGLLRVCLPSSDAVMV